MLRQKKFWVQKLISHCEVDIELKLTEVFTIISGGSPPKKKGRLTRGKKQTSRKTSSTTTEEGEEEETDGRKRPAAQRRSEGKSEGGEDELNKTQSDEEMAEVAQHVEEEVRF